MPLPPLEDPGTPLDRAVATARALPISTALFSSLLAFNAAQTSSLVLLPVAPGTFRTLNRWAADTWWGWCVTWSKWMNGVDVEVTGDQVPMRENAIVTLNHQEMSDITFLMVFARSKDRLGDMKWMVKDIIKYFPGVGWGMLFIDCIFVKRDWTSDEASIRQTFAKLRDNDVPVWLLSFPEGTRIKPGKLAKSQEWARSQGLPEPKHTLMPRTKGFVATVEGLRDHVTAVYDVTVGYEGGVPTLWQFIKGYAKRAHLHVRRYPIDDIPSESDEATAWLQRVFQEKNELLDGFYETGAFPAEPYHPSDVDE